MPSLADLDEKLRDGKPPRVRAPVVLTHEQLRELHTLLCTQGFVVLGPQVRDGAIVYDRLTSLDQLPTGWIDEQSNGRYSLQPGSSQTLFGYTVGPHSWKRFLYPPQQRLFTSDRMPRGFSNTSDNRSQQRYALFGVRSCDLTAIARQDRIFLHGHYVDFSYQSRRESCFIVAVNCGRAAATCFCASMNAGPRVESGYDLALTEIETAHGYRYLAEVGSEFGAEIIGKISHEPATEADLRIAEQLLAATSAHMGRSLDTRGLKEMLYRNFEHPIWDAIAERCLSCGNCTMVCPTCFCTTIEDSTDLSGHQAERWRRWDSCFTLNFSYIHGGSIRVSAKSRFRQWMTHKLAAWIDQFGAYGCVGCGRCITWCPVGIDITAEARTLRESEMIGPEEFSRSTHDSSNA